MKISNLLILLALGFSAIQNGYAQEKHGAPHNPQPLLFPNPEVPPYLPEMVKAADAAVEARENLPTSGFSAAYFAKEDLLELMKPNKAVGIRFYIAMDEPKQRFSDVLAVAVDVTGKEVAQFLERKYRIVKALDAHYPDEVQWMNRSNAKRCINNIMNGNSGYEVHAAYLSISSLTGLFNMQGATGIKVASSKYQHTDGRPYQSMSFAPAMIRDNDVSEIPGNDFLKSKLPCPVECGDEIYLWDR